MAQKRSFQEIHKLVKEFHYESKDVERGYNNRTLFINISDNTIQSRPVTDEMRKLFNGGVKAFASGFFGMPLAKIRSGIARKMNYVFQVAL